ncbi:DUF58 domain-containing protein [Verrucomicrobiota bacterium]
MIVPGNKLLFWLALLLPFAGFGAMSPDTTILSLSLFAVFFIIVAVDAVLGSLRTKTIKIDLPDLVRLSKDKNGSIPIMISNESMKGLSLRVGLPLPEHIDTKQDDLNMTLPERHKDLNVEWECVPRARGSFVINKCFYEISSPLGFWNARSSSDCRAELRVYPNLMNERKKLASIFLNRGNFGMHTQRVVGQGRDFEKLRDYIPGDGYDDIHWKATAKRGKPVTKLYQIERTQEIYVVIDSSRLSARTNGSDSALERFITSALVLGLVAQQQGDLFGIITFGDRIKSFIRAGGGKSHYNVCRDALYTMSPEICSPNFDELCSFIRLRLRRRALLLILTDLGDPALAQSFINNIQMISRQHLILVSMIRQAWLQPLFSESNAESDDDLYEKLGGHMLWNNIKELDKTLKHRGVGFSLSDNQKLSTDLVAQYMNIKARQLI